MDPDKWAWTTNSQVVVVVVVVVRVIVMARGGLVYGTASY